MSGAPEPCSVGPSGTWPRAPAWHRTIADFETDLRRPYTRTLKDLREVFERAGVEFLDAAEGKGVGVRLRQP